MSAAAHLLRRRSSLLLQQRHKIHPISLPSLVTTPQSHNRLSASLVGSWNFTTTATTSKAPESSSTGDSSSSRSRTLKLATAGAAVLVLSTAAWYTTRDEFSQVQHVGLPQVFQGHYQDKEASNPIDEKSQHLVQSNGKEELYQEELLPQTGDGSTGEYDQTDVGKPLQELAGKNTSLEVSDSQEQELENGSPQPTESNDPILAVSEHDFGHEDTVHEGLSPSEEATQESSLPSKEADEEPILSLTEPEQETQTPVEALTEAVKDKVSIPQEYISNDSSDASKEKSDEQEHTKEEISTIREKLKEENPDMFYSDSDTVETDDNHLGDEVSEEEPEYEEILEGGVGEYNGADRVPSKLSASYLVHIGHEDSVRRYSEKGREGGVSSFVETTGEPSREEEHNRVETKVAEEKSNVVGVDILVGAIHTAEQLQAEVDGRTFEEQLQKIQEAHKREVKDFQAKIVAYAEDTHQLEKELKKEKEEAALALERQEKAAEERLQSELKHKEEEAMREKERLQLLGKAEASASITRQKADHLEDIHSIKLQVDALRTAFYTRSEEARISHTAHKLAMGAFALEDAVEKGEPVEKEAILLIASAGGPGVDPLVDAVVSSLPSEVLTAGTRTQAQLHQKFTRLKGSLRELALMPSGGGGLFAHLFARLAATLKVSEQGSDNVGSEGIEVVIGRVERLLSEEKLLEAAAVLETGVRGTAAEDLAVDWARQARNRAIIEQGLQVLRAHVVAVASGLA